MYFFSRDYISALRVAGPSNFYMHYDWPRLASAHPQGGPPQKKKFNRENSKFGLKFSLLGLITSGLHTVSSWNFFQSTFHKAGVINWVQFLEGPPPKIWHGKKKPSKIRRDFWKLSTLIMNVSRTDPHVENRKSSLSTSTTPTLAEKKLVYFGP